MSFFEYDGKQNYYKVYGSYNEEAILYLHGGPGANCLDFEKQAECLSKNTMVVTADQLGVLRSDALINDDVYGMKNQVDIFEELRKYLKVKKWILIGHSYGGTLACKYIEMYPQSVKSVILECPSIYMAYSVKSAGRFFKNYFVKNSIDEGITACDKIEKAKYLENDRKALDDIISMLNIIKDEKTRNYLHNISNEEYMKSMNFENITNDMWKKSELHVKKLIDDGDMFKNYLPVLKRFNGTKLLLLGRFDPVCRDEQVEYYKSEIPDGEIVMFEESGHFPRVEEKEKYTRTIVEFVSKK